MHLHPVSTHHISPPLSFCSCKATLSVRKVLYKQKINAHLD